MASLRSGSPRVKLESPSPPPWPRIKLESPEIKVESPDIKAESLSPLPLPLLLPLPRIKLESPEIKIESPKIKVETPVWSPTLPPASLRLSSAEVEDDSFLSVNTWQGHVMVSDHLLPPTAAEILQMYPEGDDDFIEPAAAAATTMPMSMSMSALDAAHYQAVPMPMTMPQLPPSPWSPVEEDGTFPQFGLPMGSNLYDDYGFDMHPYQQTAPPACIDPLGIIKEECSPMSYYVHPFGMSLEADPITPIPGIAQYTPYHESAAQYDYNREFQSDFARAMLPYIKAEPASAGWSWQTPMRQRTTMNQRSLRRPLCPEMYCRVPPVHANEFKRQRTR